MQIKYFQSEPKVSPFAPEWYYTFGEDKIEDVNFQELSKFLLQKEKELIQTPLPYDFTVVDAYTGLGENSVTSRWGSYNLLSFDNPEIKKIRNNIFVKYLSFMDAVGIERSDVYIQCWFNVLRKGQSIKPHIHSTGPYCYLGGHITVQSEHTETVYINPINQINEPQEYKSLNEIGKITFFQQNIPHYTTIHDGESERISIAFDIVMKEGIDFTKPASKNMILLDEITQGNF